MVCYRLVWARHFRVYLHALGQPNDCPPWKWNNPKTVDEWTLLWMNGPRESTTDTNYKKIKHNNSIVLVSWDILQNGNTKSVGLQIPTLLNSGIVTGISDQCVWNDLTLWISTSFLFRRWELIPVTMGENELMELKVGTRELAIAVMIYVQVLVPSSVKAL